MSDIQNESWFIPVIIVAAIGVVGVVGVVGIPRGIKKYFNKTNETPYIEPDWNKPTRSGTQGFGIKKSKKHNYFSGTEFSTVSEKLYFK